MISYDILKTTDLGDLLLVAADGKLTGIYFNDRKHAPKPKLDWRFEPKHPVLKQAGAELREYLAGRRKSFSTPLCPAGTDFQSKVWRQIARIPYGETITYSELARRAGKPAAVRAAGMATGRNPLSVVVPSSCGRQGWPHDRLCRRLGSKATAAGNGVRCLGVIDP